MPENSVPVILKVTEVRVQAQWAAKALGTAPIENLLYQVNVPAKHIQETSMGPIINNEGLSMIIRALEGVLNAEF